MKYVQRFAALALVIAGGWQPLEAQSLPTAFAETTVHADGGGCTLPYIFRAGESRMVQSTGGFKPGANTAAFNADGLEINTGTTPAESYAGQRKWRGLYFWADSTGARIGRDFPASTTPMRVTAPAPQSKLCMRVNDEVGKFDDNVRIDMKYRVF